MTDRSATDHPVGSAAVPTDVVYDTQVQAVGRMATDFRHQGLMIFFGESVPEELYDFVIRHRPALAVGSPGPGDLIELDDQRFVVTAVGGSVRDNLLQLGHFCLKADGAVAAPLSGDVCVQAGSLPDLQVGSTMRVICRSTTPVPPDHR